jgi:phage-related baseplate assembly protein
VPAAPPSWAGIRKPSHFQTSDRVHAKSVHLPIADVAVIDWAKAAPDIARVTMSADGVSADEMVDSVQSDESGNDKVDGNDVI